MKLEVELFAPSIQKNTNLEIFFDEGIINSQSKETTVVYLLHGFGGDAKSWEKNTRLPQYVLGKNVICVALSGDNSFYLPNIYGFNYEAFIVKDIRQFMAFLFPLITFHEQIVGLSMGGYGAARLGLKYRQYFEKVGMFSSVTDIEIAAKDRMVSQVHLDQLVEANKDITLETYLKSGEKPPFIKQYCGVDDPFFAMNEEFYEKARKENIPIEFEKRPGNHNWDFWDSCLKDYLNEMFD